MDAKTVVLISHVIEQIEEDLSQGDTSALEAMLVAVSRLNTTLLPNFLSDDRYEAVLSINK